MATYVDLTKSLKDYRGNPSQIYGNPIKVSIDDIKAVSSTNTVYIKGQAQGNKLYNVTLAFNKIDITDEETQGYLNYTNDNGDTIYFEQPSLRSTPIKVKCTCFDFRFRFMYPNSKVKALVGKVKSYQRKTSTRPPTNPEDIPGYCKHIYWFVQKLLQENVVRE